MRYIFITIISLRNQIAYIWDLLSRSLFILIILFVFSQLWTSVYQQQGQIINGFTLNDTLWYFLFAEMMEIGKIRHDHLIADEVKSGTIAYTIIRPYNYLGFHFFFGLGETFIKIGLVGVIGSILIVNLAGLPDFSFLSLFPALIISILALILDFIIMSFVGLLAFVAEETRSLRLIYQKLNFVLGGLLIPIDFLPDRIRTVVEFLPFNLVIYAPAKTIVGFSSAQFVKFLSLQLFWITFLGIMLFMQYRWAMRRLEINGG